MRTSRKLFRRVSCLTSMVAALAVCASPAVAASTRPFLHAFGPQGFSAGVPSGAFSKLQGIAVDQTTEDVYVYDAGFEGGSIYKFNAAGEPVDFSALGSNVIEHVGAVGEDEGELAVDSSSGPDSGDVFFASGESDGNTVLIYNAHGEPAGELKETAGAPWGEPCGVAVDSAGDVYVGLYSEHVNEYTPKAGTVTNADYVRSLFGLEDVCNIAANAEGDLYTNRYATRPEGVVTKYAASQFNTSETPASGEQIDEHGSTLTTDPFSSEVFIDELASIGEYDSTGTRLAAFGETGAGALSGSYGVAVDHPDDQVYADDETVVKIFGALEEVATGSQWATTAATSVTATSATLHGTVNPGGAPVTKCEFEYGPTDTYGHSAPCEQSEAEIGSGMGAVEVSAKVTGLSSGTKYYFRVTGTGVIGVGYGGEETFTTLVAPPTATIRPVTEIAAHAATFNGAVNPKGSTTIYRFEDSTDSVTWTPLGENSAGNGTGEVAVSQPVSGLLGATTYHVRLVAEHAGGPSVTSDETTFSTLASAPQIFGAGATVISGSEATLYATIYPEKQTTTYRFEYGPTEAYGSSVPVGEGSVGSSPTQVTQTLAGLQPLTTYHSRVVATNATGSPTTTPDQTFTTTLVAGEGEAVAPGACPNEALRAESNTDPLTGASYSTQLPDCRAYEQVTPPFKGANAVNTGPYVVTQGTTSIENILPEGSELRLKSLSFLGDAVPGADAEENPTNYDLMRTTGGWQAASLSPPASEFPVSIEQLASPLNAAVGLWTAATPSQSIFAEDFYRREADGTFVSIGLIAPPAATAGPPHIAESKSEGPRIREAAIVGTSSDLGSVVFQLDSRAEGNKDYLWPGDGTVTSNGASLPSLYEYVGTGHSGEDNDVPALVGVDNGEIQISQCGTGLGADVRIEPQIVHNGISVGGSTVFFTAQTRGCAVGATGPVSNQLYARIGTPGAPQTTVNVAAGADCATTSCNVTSPVTFQGASSDGSKVFFTTTQALLPSDKDTTNDIYECDLPGDAGGTPAHEAGVVNACPHLTAVSVTGTSGGADVQSVVAISEEGARVYFTATGVLTSTSNDQGASAEAGKDNLYVWEAGRTAFIAIVPTPTLEGAQATPDGRYLVFTATADLTAGDTSTAAQAFRYDAQNGELLRVSVGQNGFNDNGNSNSDPVLLASIKPRFGGFVVSEDRTISENGSYILFQSSNALTSEVHGGTNNVYEWHEGNVYLISDGTDTQERSGLIGMDASGANIFFVTADKLVGQDTDEDYDVYDARIDGGFPKPTPEAGCSGEACQGPLSGSLTSFAPLISSTGIPAIGNLAARSSTKPAARKPLTRSQKLDQALKQCKKDVRRAKKERCERKARARYGRKHKASKRR